MTLLGTKGAEKVQEASSFEIARGRMDSFNDFACLLHHIGRKCHKINYGAPYYVKECYAPAI